LDFASKAAFSIEMVAPAELLHIVRPAIRRAEAILGFFGVFLSSSQQVQFCVSICGELRLGIWA
jgi:hypothetical protein